MSREINGFKGNRKPFVLIGNQIHHTAADSFRPDSHGLLQLCFLLHQDEIFCLNFNLQSNGKMFLL